MLQWFLKKNFFIASCVCFLAGLADMWVNQWMVGTTFVMLGVLWLLFDQQESEYENRDW